MKQQPTTPPYPNDGNIATDFVSRRAVQLTANDPVDPDDVLRCEAALAYGIDIL